MQENKKFKNVIKQYCFENSFDLTGSLRVARSPDHIIITSMYVDLVKLPLLLWGKREVCQNSHTLYRIAIQTGYSNKSKSFCTSINSYTYVRTNFKVINNSVKMSFEGLTVFTLAFEVFFLLSLWIMDVKF